jgi:signal transduction histidine kinase
MTFLRIMRSIRLKLLTAILVTTAIALLLAGAALLFIDMRDYHSVAMRDMQTQLALIGRASAPALQFGDPQVAAENLSLLDIRPSFEAAAVYNAQGQLFATYVRHGIDVEFPRFPGNEGVGVEGGKMFAFHRIIFEDQIVGTIYARANYPINERLLQGAGIIGIIIAVALGLAALMSGWLRWYLIRPIVGISTTARQIVSSRDYSLRAEKLSDDEVGDLADSFNAMLAEIEARAGELERFNRDLQNEVTERRRVEAEVWRLNRELDSRVRKRTRQLEQANAELEAFAYSVSHDLRAPLRSIDGYGEALAEELGEQLSEDARRYLEKIRSSTRRMGQLIEELLNLSRLSRAEMHYDTVDLSEMAGEIIEEHRQRDPDRKVHVVIWDGITAKGDPQLIRVVMVNLLSKSECWKRMKDQYISSGITAPVSIWHTPASCSEYSSACMARTSFPGRESGSPRCSGSYGATAAGSGPMRRRERARSSISLFSLMRAAAETIRKMTAMRGRRAAVMSRLPAEGCHPSDGGAACRIESFYWSRTTRRMRSLR